MTLRSQDWYGGEGRDPYIHRAWMRRGIPADAFNGKRPQIAIANTAGDLVPCNLHLNEVAQYVKNGVYEAGGIPVEIPVMGLGETLVKPTAMLWRNLAAMQVEEMLRANPVDAVVLLDSQDWMAREDIRALWDSIDRAGSDQVRVIFRTAGIESPLEGEELEPLREIWRRDDELSDVGYQLDRSGIYGGFHCYVRR